MANPNLAGATTITAEQVFVAAGAPSTGTVINNPASSGKVFRIKDLRVTNSIGSAQTFDVKFYTEDDLGGSVYYIAKTVALAVNETVVVIDSNAPVFLPENRSIGVYCSNEGTITASYVSYS